MVDSPPLIPSDSHAGSKDLWTKADELAFVWDIVALPLRIWRDLSTNALARFRWGVEPRDESRRRKTWIVVALPVVSYCVLMMLVLLLDRYYYWPTFRQPIAPLHYEYSYPDFLASVVLASTLALGGIAIGPGLIWMLSQQADDRLMGNWPHYSVSGLTGRQMIWGIFGARLLGEWVVMALHLAVTIGCFSAFVMTKGKMPNWPGPMFFVNSVDWAWCVLVLGLSMVFSLTASLLFGTAKSVSKSKGIDTVAANVTLCLLSSPFLVLFLCSCLLGGRLQAWYGFAIFWEVISWPLRWYFVSRAWRDAIRGLDTEEGPVR